MLPDPEDIEIEPKGTRTAITIPTSLLWLLVFGGIGTLSINSWLMWQQLQNFDVRLQSTETTLNAHLATVGHEGISRYVLELERRVKALEEPTEVTP